METFENVWKLIRPNIWMVSIDIKDAYYSVKIHTEFQKYFSFEWKGKLYSYTCMPNGWGNAPYIFTKLLKPVFYHLRSQGYINSYFIDDSLLLAMVYFACKENFEVTKSLLECLGFTLNLVKSIANPTQEMLHLGNIINSVSMTVYLPQDKKQRIISLCSDLCRAKEAKIRFVARVIGTLISSLSAVELGKLHYRNLEREKIKALKVANGNFNSHMEVTHDMRQDLSWWISNVENQSRQIERTQPTITLITVSSMLGWGCIVGNESLNGRWSMKEQEQHINVLEIKAILLSLKAVTDQIYGQHIRVLSDSTTAVCYINKMGGLNSLECDKISKEIWEYCLDREAWISCQHIPGVENEADLPSRKFHDDIEWQIDNKTFQIICDIWGTPSIDLFASRTNHKVNTYCSWKKDPEATFIDAFSLNWERFDLDYLFPPFSLIAGCLQKLQQEQAEAIMIVPLWPQQMWFPFLLQCLIDNPRILPCT